MSESPVVTLPELLSPAGGPAALRAAVNNGADAVYLGVDKFNARRGAENFTLDNLAEMVRFAHVAGVRVYLTLNVLVLSARWTRHSRSSTRRGRAGVDAVIVQDLGVLSAIRSALPHVRIHASTQLNAHNAATRRDAGRPRRRARHARPRAVGPARSRHS